MTPENDKTPTRIAVYLANRARLDAPARGLGPAKGGGPAKDQRLGGKRSKDVKCKPPNRRCGARCIPPNWNCRVSGGGLDSHSKVVAFDPVAGVGGVWRGGKNLKKGIEKGDPELIARGAKGIERGITKLTPGDDIEKKQRFRRNLKTASTITAMALVGFVALRKGHRTLNRTEWYRERFGRPIDQAAYRARERFYQAMDRVPLLRSRHPRPMAPGATGDLISHGLGVQRQAALAQNADPRAATALADRIAGTHPLLSDGVPGIAAVRAVDTRARTEGMGEQAWLEAKAQALYGISRTGGPPGSGYSEPATHELLAEQFGFRLDPQGIRRGGIATEKRTVLRRVQEHITSMHESLAGDMRSRGLDPTRSADRDAFVTQFLGDHPLRMPGVRGAVATEMAQRYERQVRDVLVAADAPARRTMANSLYNSTRSQFDEYFATAYDSVARSGMSGAAQRRGSHTSDALLGLARLHAGNGFGTTPVNKDHANFLNHVYFRAQIQGHRGPINIDGARAQRVAAALRNTEGDSLSPQGAIDYLRANGYPQVHLRGGAPAAAPAPAAPPRATAPRASRPARRRALRTEAQIIAMLMQGGQSRAAAEAEARRIIGRRTTTDSPEGDLPPRIAAFLATRARLDAKGKPCGDSFIAANKKCGRKSIAQSGRAAEGLANKHDNAYRAKQVASFVARVGLTGAMGALAVKGFKDSYGKNGMSLEQKNTAFNTGLMATAVAALGTASLIRETKTTQSTEQLQKRVEELKKHDGVEPETIDKLSKFMGDVDLDAQRVNTMAILSGAAGYFDSANPDRVYVVGGFGTHDKSYKSSDPLEALTKGTAKFMDDRAKLSPGQQDARKVTNMETMRENFAVAGHVGNAKAQSTVLLLHETAHAMHYRSNFASPKYVTVGGKKYEGADLENELMRSSSIYGQSDMRRSPKATSTDYYSQGNRLETFTENYVLYATNGKKMKELYPVSYAWTKATADYALSKPAKKEPRPFADLLGDLMKGTERFDPPSGKRRRTDSPEDDFFALYDRMQTAALAGDLRTATIILGEAQALPMEQRQMVAALLETAAMYALEEGPGAGRSDAAPGPTPEDGPVPPRVAAYLATRARLDAKGKPCGASHIAASKKCGKGAGAEAPPEGGTPPAPTPSPSKGLGRKVALAAGAAAVIAAVGVTGYLVARDAKRLYKNETLPPPISYRSAVKQGKGGDPKVKHDAALGNYYDDVVAKQGWKPGELVYTALPSNSNPGAPSGAHFAVYMGKSGSMHQFAEIIVDETKRGESFVSISDVGAGAKRMPPLIYTKAPPLKGEKRPYSPEQISQRIYSQLGGKMRYDKLDNNCESWARMIVSGQPRSTQVDRLSKVTQTLVRGLERATGPRPSAGTPSLAQVAKRLDLYERINAGDRAAEKELKVFEGLLKKGKRTDAVASPLADLPEAGDVLAGATSDADVVLRTKHFLMLIVAAAGGLATPERADAGEKRLGKPCGASHIAKNLKCGKDAPSATGNRLRTAAKLALVAGVVAGGTALALRSGRANAMRAKLHKVGAHGLDPKDPDFAESHYNKTRVFGKSYTAQDMKQLFDGVDDSPLVDKRALRKFTSWLETNDIGMPADAVDRAAKTYGPDFYPIRAELMQNPHIMGAYIDGQPQAIWVRRVGHLDRWNNDVAQDAVRSIDAQMPRNKLMWNMNDNLQAHIDRDGQQAVEDLYAKTNTMSSGTQTGSTKDLIHFVHEVGHSVHDRVGYNTDRFFTTINGHNKLVNPHSEDFINEVKRFTSSYGASSLTEAFAEAHVAYVFGGKRLQAEAPQVYAWIENVYYEANNKRVLKKP
jgi:hypothetical protein